MTAKHQTPREKYLVSKANETARKERETRDEDEQEALLDEWEGYCHELRITFQWSFSDLDRHVLLPKERPAWMPPEAAAALALRLNDDGTVHCERPDGSAFDLDPDKVPPKLLACLVELKEKGYAEEETIEALRAKPEDSKDSTK